MNNHTKSEVKWVRCSGNTLCWTIEQSDWQTEFQNSPWHAVSAKRRTLALPQVREKVHIYSLYFYQNSKNLFLEPFLELFILWWSTMTSFKTRKFYYWACTSPYIINHILVNNFKIWLIQWEWKNRCLLQKFCHLSFWTISIVVIPPPDQPKSSWQVWVFLGMVGHAWPHPSSSSSLRYYFLCQLSLCKKSKTLIAFFHWSMIKEPCSHTRAYFGL